MGCESVSCSDDSLLGRCSGSDVSQGSGEPHDSAGRRGKHPGRGEVGPPSGGVFVCMRQGKTDSRGSMGSPTWGSASTKLGAGLGLLVLSPYQASWPLWPRGKATSEVIRGPESSGGCET